MRAKLAWAVLAAACVLASAGSSASAEDGAAVLSDISQESTGRSTRITIASSGPIAYTYYSPDPLTLVVDIPEVDASKVPSRISVGTREVESLRVTPLARADGRSLTRVEVRLASLVPYQIYSKGQALNLVFERPAETAEVRPEPPAAPPAQPSEPTPAAETPAEVPAPEPAPPVEVKEPAPAAPAGPATKIVGVSQALEEGQLAVTVRADGKLRYQDFFLGNPDRLVVDFKDVISRAPVRALDVAQGPVKRIRLAQFSAQAPRVARLVLDLESRAPYQLVEARDGVKIVFGEGREPKPAPLAALRAEAPPAAAPTVALAATPVSIKAAVVSNPPALALPPLPEPLQVTPTTEIFEPRTVGPAEKKFTGHPISLDFKDGDLQDIFRLFADISGLNVVVNPGVSGKVTLKLTEVPWDQALDLILKTNGLGMTLEDNVIRIARLSDLQKEEADLRKLKEEAALAGDLIVWRKSLSYAKAGEMEPTVKKVALSARGNITLDNRTNTMIITDLPVNIEKAKELIADLDRATPQVEIEARIVVTSRNFTRDLGIQWGFLNQQTPQFGNTTNMSFPHSIILNGQGVPGGGLQANQAGLAAPAGVGTVGRGYAVNLPATGFNSAIGISLGNILGSFNLDAALTALERQGRGRLLSTPKVTTQNNQEAEIKQGVQIPIQTVANNTVTVQFKDAVLTLKVTPQITEASTVILNIDVQNNTADFANLVNGIPPINTQSAKTNVLVRDGATTVIGGIYQSNEQTSQQRTPFFSQLPILGYLFRNRFVTSNSNELLLFITPRIIK
ncbi:MAG TPA: type IV pilus secretin PilQ [Vicinamibacteria bacterium]|nr:type IV pilus secretin PilQ [Vicinamibacteria bacterium]